MQDYIDSISDIYYLQYISGIMSNVGSEINLDPNKEEVLWKCLEQIMQDLENRTNVCSEAMKEKSESMKK